jgi:hypothetical protein
MLTQYLLSNSNSVVTVLGQMQRMIGHLRMFDSCLTEHSNGGEILRKIKTITMKRLVAYTTTNILREPQKGVSREIREILLN